MKLELNTQFITKFEVDKTAGKLVNVALLTSGEEAKGHNVKIDDETLLSALNALGEKKQIKGKLTHYNYDSELRIPGFFSNIRIQERSLVADFEFFDWFKKDRRDDYKIIMEMAAKAPDIFGVSIESVGEAETKEDGDYYRVEKLLAAAFVAEPAVNDSLFAFSAKKLYNKYETLKTNLNTENIMKDILEKINTEYKDVNTKVYAFELLTKDGSLTFDKIQEKVASFESEQKVKNFEAKITELETEKTNLETKYNTLKTEKEALESKFEALKDKGEDNFDAGSGGDEVVSNYSELLKKFEKMADGPAKTEFYNKHIKLI